MPQARRRGKPDSLVTGRLRLRKADTRVYQWGYEAEEDRVWKRKLGVDKARRMDS